MGYTNNDVRKLRRMAAKQGYYVTFRRNDLYPGTGFMLINAYTNCVVLGGSPLPYWASYEEVFDFLTN